MQKRFFAALMIALSLAIATPALAEEPDLNTPVSSEVTTPEGIADTSVVDTATAQAAIAEVTANDLGVAEPTVLPGSFFYPFKRFAERIQESLTFDPAAKAEIQQRLANKRLVEARKLAANGKSEEATKILEDYKLKMEAAQDRLSSIDRASLTPEQQAKLDAVSDRITANLLKQQAVLERVESQVPEQAQEKIRENIERNQKRVEERLAQLPADQQEQVKARIDEIMKQVPADELSRSEYLERLRQVRSEVVPAAVIEQITTKSTEAKARVDAAVAAGKIDPSQAAQKIQEIEERTQKHIERVEEQAQKTGENIQQRIEVNEKLKDLKAKADQAATPQGKAEIREEAKAIKEQSRAEIQQRAQDFKNKLKEQMPPAPKATPAQ